MRPAMKIHVPFHCANAKECSRGEPGKRALTSWLASMVNGGFPEIAVVAARSAIPKNARLDKRCGTPVLRLRRRSCDFRAQCLAEGFERTGHARGFTGASHESGHISYRETNAMQI